MIQKGIHLKYLAVSSSALRREIPTSYQKRGDLYAPYACLRHAEKICPYMATDRGRKRKSVAKDDWHDIVVGLLQKIFLLWTQSRVSLFFFISTSHRMMRQVL